mmetsp:Transcript_119391/g.380766  ORF Transcript_119391/g.380766 Transcript_119391/m.380766 type:complete len:252 (+) Transcript_119391:1-756(+)
MLPRSARPIPSLRAAPTRQRPMLPRSARPRASGPLVRVRAQACHHEGLDRPPAHRAERPVPGAHAQGDIEGASAAEALVGLDFAVLVRACPGDLLDEAHMAILGDHLRRHIDVGVGIFQAPTCGFLSGSLLKRARPGDEDAPQGLQHLLAPLQSRHCLGQAFLRSHGQLGLGLDLVPQFRSHFSLFLQRLRNGHQVEDASVQLCLESPVLCVLLLLSEGRPAELGVVVQGRLVRVHVQALWALEWVGLVLH